MLGWRSPEDERVETGTHTGDVTMVVHVLGRSQRGHVPAVMGALRLGGDRYPSPLHPQNRAVPVRRLGR